MFASIMRFFITFLIALLGFLASGNAIADGTVAKASVLAPDFKLDGEQGSIHLKQHRGQLIYLDFWASWCQPCKKSFDWMNQMQARYGNEGLKIIAINLDEDRSKAERFLKNLPANFTVAYDPQGITAEQYQVKAMPSSYIIDKNGHLLYTNKGFRGNDKEELEFRIRQYIRQATVANNTL
jgi:cytochrome c biogenesis protein CcmG/thiol:disulfide interchange protein DsbE